MRPTLQLNTKSSQAVNGSTTNTTHNNERKEINDLLNLQETGEQKEEDLRQRSFEVNKRTCISHNFSNIPVHLSKTPLAQTKLSVNNPGDEYEQEADAVADKVMRANGNAVEQTKINPVSIIQRGIEPTLNKEETEETEVTEEEEETEDITEENEKPRKRKEVRSVKPTVSAAVNQTLQSAGEPMDKNTRSFMEKRFGYDFSKVRIHNDSLANESAKDIHAMAYTHQHHIAFGAGKYQPQTEPGKRLLAHELTHVIQQSKMKYDSLIQKGDDSTKNPKPEKRVNIPVKIPPGINSDLQFKRYAEVKIFGKVINAKWDRNLGDDYCRSHIGETIYFNVPISDLGNYGKDNPDKEVIDNEYGSLGGEEQSDINDEIDQRYYESTNIDPAEKIQKGESGKMAIWNSIKRQVMAEKMKLDSLPAGLKEFLKSDQTFTPENYRALTEIATVLKQFDAADFFDYKSKIDEETTDLERLKNALQNYLKEKAERKKELNSKEVIKTKLEGTENIYQQYKDYITKRDSTMPAGSGAGAVKAMGNWVDWHATLPQDKIDLETNLKAKGFNSIQDFEKHIKDYELAFRKETILIAQDHLKRYNHLLYEEEKKINDPVYLANLFSELAASGAKGNYDAADSKTTAAIFVMAPHGDHIPDSQIDRQVDLAVEANAQNEKGATAVLSIPSVSPLMKEDKFDKKAVAVAGSQEKLKSIMLSYISKKRGEVEETWGDINAHQDRIYELDNLILLSKSLQQVDNKSIYGLIIQDKIKELSKGKLLKAICFIIISIVLVAASFGTGAIAIAAAGASLGMSLYGVYEEIEKYKRDSSAHDVGLLSDDPSLGWVLLAIVGAGLDAAGVSAAFKAAKPIAEATTVFNKSAQAAEDVLKLEKDLAAIADLQAEISKNITRAAEAQSKARQALNSIVEAGGRLNSVIIPGTHEFVKLTMAAYQVIKKGVLDFSTFLKELKAAKLIEDVAVITEEQRLILKQAFEKGRELSQAGDDIAKEIETAIKEGNFSKLDVLVNTTGKAAQYTVDWTVLEAKIMSRLSTQIEQKVLDKMIKTLKSADSEGLKLANKLEQGTFENVEGYIDLVKKASIDKQSIKAVNQAIDKAETLIAEGAQKDALRFEHDLQTGVHDVDVGIKDASSAGSYTEAYQLKTLTSKINKRMIQDGAIQLKTVKSPKKILEFRCTPDTTLADLTGEAIVKEMKFQAGLIDPSKGAGITEFRFILSDGKTVIKKPADL